MINLRSKPFNLSAEDIQWVESTLAGMDLETKVGHLFLTLITDPDPEITIQNMKEAGIKPCGYMARPLQGKEVQNLYRTLQQKSPIPLLLAANLEKGGDGIALDGTTFGSQLQISATDDEEMAYKLGLIAGREGQAVGCNYAFAPVIDIDLNFNNPITNTRTYGADPEKVLRMARAYIKGIQENGIAVSIKHFPGDGVDGRDQHLLASVNSLSTKEWDATYGKIYQSLIDEGAETVMIGHIMQPAYSKKLNTALLDNEILPASLSSELNQELLRNRMGFNGVIISDATTMAGFTAAMSREKAVPYCIEVGMDIFLFTINPKQDYEFMLNGVNKGILSRKRLDEAVTRILALKASLKLHEKQKSGTLVPDESVLGLLNCEEHRLWAKQCADQAITLVKDTQQLLPISITKHKKVLLYVLGDESGYMAESSGINKVFIDRLSKEGFDIEKFDYEALKGMNMWNLSQLADPIGEIEKYDLVIYLASLRTASNQTIVRINWAQPMGADVPKFVNEVPMLFISVDNPYHLQDVPMIKTFINGYTSSEYVIEAIVDKLVGKSAFVGKSPIDPFCGLWDTKN